MLLEERECRAGAWEELRRKTPTHRRSVEEKINAKQSTGVRPEEPMARPSLRHPNERGREEANKRQTLPLVCCLLLERDWNSLVFADD